MIAVLYADPRGIYAGLPDVDLWDETRDARRYPGPHPVVAHPPCARWCRLAGLVEARWGHRRGEDGGTFAAGLAAVRRWGGTGAPRLLRCVARPRPRPPALRRRLGAVALRSGLVLRGRAGRVRARGPEAHVALRGGPHGRTPCRGRRPGGIRRSAGPWSPGAPTTRRPATRDLGSASVRPRPPLSSSGTCSWRWPGV